MLSKKLLLAGLITFSSIYAEAKVIFAMNNQYFSESFTQDKEGNKTPTMHGGRYDIGDVIVSTNLARWKSGVLGTLNRRSDGFFVVDSKKPIKNWAVSVNVNYAFHSGCSEDISDTIRIGADNGESIYITTNPCDVIINDTQIKLRKKESLSKVSLNYFIKTEGKNIKVMLNGQTLVTLPKGKFSNLKTVELNLASISKNSNSIYDNRYDYFSFIQNLSISEK